MKARMSAWANLVLIEHHKPISRPKSYNNRTDTKESQVTTSSTTIKKVFAVEMLCVQERNQ